MNPNIPQRSKSLIRQPLSTLSQNTWNILVPSYANTVACSEPSTLVPIRVGKDDDVETFLVHKEVVCRHSPVLKAAFNSGFIEGQTQTYELSHVNSETAKMLVQWLYAQEVTIKQLKQGWKYSEDKIHEDEADLEDTNLVNLWILADELQIPRLQNYALRIMDDISKAQDAAPTHIYKLVYEGTREGSSLRRYVVAVFGLSMPSEKINQHSMNFTFEFLLDIATFHAEIRDNGKDELVLSEYMVEVGDEMSL